MRTIHTSRLVPRARELRRGQTPAERKLWFCFLRAYDIKFRRQVPLAGYVLDFYAPSLKLCIELDGRSHDTAEAQHYDALRTETLTAAGITVLRFSNEAVSRRFSAVCTAIERTCHPLASPCGEVARSAGGVCPQRHRIHHVRRRSGHRRAERCGRQHRSIE